MLAIRGKEIRDTYKKCNNQLFDNYHSFFLVEEEKEQGLAANIQCELIELFFYHVQDNSIFDDFISYIEKEKVLSKIEYEIFIRKELPFFPSMVNKFYSNDEIKKIYNDIADGHQGMLKKI